MSALQRPSAVVYYSPSSNDSHVAGDLAALRAALAGRGVDGTVSVIRAATTTEALRELQRHGARTAAVVAKAGFVESGEGSGSALLVAALGQFPSVFRVLYSRTVSCEPEARLAWMHSEAQGKPHMVSHVLADVAAAVAVEAAETGEGEHTCPLCGKERLTAAEMWRHMPAFHMGDPMVLLGSPLPLRADARSGRPTAPGAPSVVSCPICGACDARVPLLRHVHSAHPPPGVHAEPEGRPSVSLFSFGLAVVRRRKDGKFLCVQEYCGQGYWLPGGGIDAGEDPAAATRRETLEEAGVAIRLLGVLRVEVTPGRRGLPGSSSTMRMRYIFYGEPEDESAEPKTIPDFESLGACWVSVEEITSGRLRLRGSEPEEWFSYVAEGGTIHPMSLLAREGAPLPPVK